MKKTISAVLLLCCAVFLLPAEQSAPVPAGFEWRYIPEIKAAFMVPTGWQYLREVLPNVTQYHYTKLVRNTENAKANFGLTIRVLKDVVKENVEKFPSMMIAALALQQKIVKQWEFQSGFLQGMGAETITGPVGESDSRKSYTLIGVNPKTKTVYVILFEASIAQWDAAWKFGATMFSTFILDDSI